MSPSPIQATWFSDVLCIWAYVAQIRIDELQQKFAGRVHVEQRSVPVFGSTAAKIGRGWEDRGGFAGYARHVQEIAARFDHVEVHPEAWTRDVPAGSLAPHCFLKAAALAVEAEGDVDELAWRLRLAFFRDLRNVATLEVQLEVAEELGLPLDSIRRRLRDGSALAALAEDHEAAAKLGVTGSPTLLLNEGRQKLYGNVGYRVIEANVEELLRDRGDRASWC